MIRAALYTRVSTEEMAKDGFSLSAQEHRLRAYAMAQGWTVAQVFCDDGYTGRDMKRPAYKAIMAQKDSWDILVVLKLDRLHRNLPNLLEMVAGLEKEGKDFASVMESLDTSSAIGRFVLTIMGSLAQLESEQIGERTFAGMAEKARLGKGSLGAPTPYGYRRADGKLYPAPPSEVEAVQTIFRLARAGMAGQAISKMLRKMHPDSGREWTRFQVRDIMRNPVYAGVVLWNGIHQGQRHEAIVTIEEFNAVQDRHKTGLSVT